MKTDTMPLGGGGIQVNIKATATALVLGGIFIYVVYLWSLQDRSSVKLQPDSMAQLRSWKSTDFVPIPSDILENAPNINVKERRLTFEFDGKSGELFMREVAPSGGNNKVQVLLLHGAAFTSETWTTLGTLQLIGSFGYRAIALDLPEADLRHVYKTLTVILLHGQDTSADTWNRLGTIKYLAAFGYRVIALDIPGWGLSSKYGEVEDKAGFLAKFIYQEKLGRPVIISPSMSGSFSIPYIMGDKPVECTDRVLGFVPVAPTDTDKYTHAQWHRCETPTMIVYGTEDKNLGLFSVGNLRNMPNSEIFPIEKAKHPAYLDNPAQWHMLLYNFLLAVEREAS